MNDFCYKNFFIQSSNSHITSVHDDNIGRNGSSFWWIRKSNYFFQCSRNVNIVAIVWNHLGLLVVAFSSLWDTTSLIFPLLNVLISSSFPLPAIQSKWFVTSYGFDFWQDKTTICTMSMFLKSIRFVVHHLVPNRNDVILLLLSFTIRFISSSFIVAFIYYSADDDRISNTFSVSVSMDVAVAVGSFSKWFKNALLIVHFSSLSLKRITLSSFFTTASKTSPFTKIFESDIYGSRPTYNW